MRTRCGVVVADDRSCPHMGVFLVVSRLHLVLAFVISIGSAVATGESGQQHGGLPPDVWRNSRNPNGISTDGKAKADSQEVEDKGTVLSLLIRKAEKTGSSVERQKKAGFDGKSGDSAAMIPTGYVLFVRLGSRLGGNSSNVLTELSTTLASILGVPVDHARIRAIRPDTNTVEMYFVKSGHSWERNSDLIPAHNVEATIATSRLVEMLPSIDVRDVYTTDALSMSVDSGAPWSQPYFPYLMAGGAACILILVIIFAVIGYRWRQSKGEALSGRSSPSPPPHFPPIQQQICLYPLTKPHVQPATLIQPDVTQIHTNKSCGECGTPLHTPPLRLKKGLLERRHTRLKKSKGRGSNASLTLDLGASTPENKPTWGSPPKESSAEEYLLSAGNRMSRKQLRNCLKNVKLLHEEFWEIPMNHPDKVAIPGSGMKNRYRTIIPNEHSRVRLPETEDDILTTYINANIIRGYGAEPRAYIATQGPMSHTIVDFWQMIWQERAPIVVMITKLKEKNKVKCESYLPETGSCQYGPFEVRVMGVEERDGCIIRHLAVKVEHEIHEVLHYWYTTWPDHKAPSTARLLLNLVREVDNKRHYPDTGQARGPVVVHCSAGIGRTGCFIATSIGSQQLREEHCVDVLGIVCSMRLDRGGMVQTSEQYEFIHQALCLHERDLPDRPPSGD